MFMIVSRIRLNHGMTKKEIPTFAEVPWRSFIFIIRDFTLGKDTSNQGMVPWLLAFIQCM